MRERNWGAPRRSGLRVVLVALGGMLIAIPGFSQAPTITSVVNSATADSRFSPGILTTITGSFPGAISSVTVNGVQGYFDTSSSTQIFFQFPYSVSPGSANIVVSNAGQSAPFAVTISSFAPSIYTANGTVQAYDLNTSRQITASSPAYPGEQLYMNTTGLGQSTPPTVAGPAQSYIPLAATPTVTVNGVQAQMLAAGIEQSRLGTDQISFVVPPDTAVGNATVIISSGGSSSPPEILPIGTASSGLAISSLSPSSVTPGGAAFTLTVNGSGFQPNAVILFAGSALPTVFVSATQLTASVPANLIANSGFLGVLVQNPGGATSNTVDLSVFMAAPAITALSPTSAAAATAFTLTVLGNAFVSGATVVWNSRGLSTTFVSPTKLTADVTASQTADGGNAVIEVINPGAIASNTISFPIYPVITSLNPSAVTAGALGFTLTIRGYGFISGSTVNWNGLPLQTNFSTSSVMTATVPANLLGSPSSVNVTVVSPGGTIVSAPFVLSVNGAAPSITGLTPISVTAGGPAFSLTVNGSGFQAGATIQWNGVDLATTFVNPTQLTAQVGANLIAAPGSVSVTAVNPGGASSSPNTLTVTAPVPVITSLTPVSATATGAAFTLSVYGSGFLSGAVVQWNGTGLPTKFMSGTQLAASVSAALIAAPGSAAIVVANPGGQSSAARTLTINAPVPAITSMSPDSVKAGGASFTLTITGTGFLAGAIVQWNGTAVSSSVVSATQITALVPAALISASGSAGISVIGPGGTPSNAVMLTISVPGPVISQGGVVPVFSSSPIIESGSWSSIYGTGLSDGTHAWNGDFPTTLGDTSVTVDGKAAYLWFVSPTQINFQVPDDSATGTVNVTVMTPAGSTTSTVTLSQYAPSFALFGNSNYVAALIPTPDGSGAYANGGYDLAGPSGSFNFNTRPVRTGEAVELFGVGFGPTDPHVPAGQIVTGAAATATPVTVIVGAASATVLFAGITEAGEYQINIIVPPVSSGDQEVVASVGGVQTQNKVFLTIQ